MRGVTVIEAMDYDVIVIGGGPSGLMAAIAAQQAGAQTLLIEKGNKLGRKLAISGGGRCNVTNAKPLDQLIQNIPGNGRFLFSALTRFSNQDVVQFFERLGIPLKEEDRGRVFPLSDKASTVVTAMVNELYALGVSVRLDTPVKQLMADEEKVIGVETHQGENFFCRAIIVAAGGASVPQTGSTGDAYPWAGALGHTIVSPYPTEVPLTSSLPRILDRSLQGLSFRDVTLTLKNGKAKILTVEQGDIIFTHFGVSGPAALRCSHYVSTARIKNIHEPLMLFIDLLPDYPINDLQQAIARRRKENPKQHVRTCLLDWMPERLTDVLLESAHADIPAPLSQLTSSALGSILSGIKSFPIPISGTLPLAKATVTGGGVSIKEIDPKTMGSKKKRGLYFCGEVMDVHAHTGGYNITVAFSTGHAAGSAAAEFSLNRQPS